MKNIKKENGSVIIICALLIPVLIGFIGVVIDAGNILYHRNCLIQATEIAGESGFLLSYDKEIWDREGIVVIKEDLLRSNVEMMFKKNCDHGQVIEVDLINTLSFELKTEIELDYIFMSIFGFETKKIESTQKFVGG